MKNVKNSEHSEKVKSDQSDERLNGLNVFVPCSLFKTPEKTGDGED